MAKAKPKEEKGNSFERYARPIQNDIAALGESVKAGFRSVHEEMATKQEMNLKFKEVQGALRDIRDDVKQITDAMVSKTDLVDALPDSREIGELRERVSHVEVELKKIAMAKKMNGGAR